MNKKLPDIYKNTFEEKDGNNKKVFYSFIGNDRNTSYENKIAINEIDYVFNKLVDINTKTGVYTTKIISKVGDHILTSDGRRVLLNEIISIKLK